MKKRLLALALCLVMATSLLPITAAAYTEEELSSSTNNAYCGDTHFKLNFRGGISILDESGEEYPSDNGKCTLPSGKKYTIIYSDDLGNNQTINISILNHNWQLTQTKNSLTATCRNPEEYKKENGRCKCSIGQASLTLDAHSVTLPDSPFNARVVLQGITEEQIKEEFGYEIGPIRYKFKAPGESTFTEITPADGAREGIYQASVTLSPMQIAARYALNDDGTTNQDLEMAPDGSITLYIQYTAVNPSVTAQTGDNRPIELMMGSVLVFSALAAAAFVLDSKRRSHQ